MVMNSDGDKTWCEPRIPVTGLTDGGSSLS